MRWISVNDKLPKHRNDVLIYSQNGCCGMGWWDQCDEQNLTVLYLATKDPQPSLDMEISARTIIGWQELPE